ncbi:MAG: hypothetical protein OEN48_10460 [Betaproteobacteria bacterium]|nr:hypothetical protein [Gammaproteobacteria bacterium]MDH3437395.1 hypothetical protein [Betaproteobacteria bacterium]
MNADATQEHPALFFSAADKRRWTPMQADKHSQQKQQNREQTRLTQHESARVVSVCPGNQVFRMSFFRVRLRYKYSRSYRRLSAFIGG